MNKWSDLYRDLAARYPTIKIFENSGELIVSFFTTRKVSGYSATANTGVEASSST
jgi:hypothetical protein